MSCCFSFHSTSTIINYQDPPQQGDVVSSTSSLTKFSPLPGRLRCIRSSITRFKVRALFCLFQSPSVESPQTKQSPAYRDHGDDFWVKGLRGSTQFSLYSTHTERVGAANTADNPSAGEPVTQVPGAHWSDSLAKLVSSRFTER